MSNEIPRSLEQLAHYLQSERIAWQDVQLGTNVLLEARDTGTNQNGFFGFKVLESEQMKNGLTSVTLEVEENDFTLTRGDNRQQVKLPRGTLMREGVSCQHFPETNAFMSYLGGINVARDYSFSEVLTPDGEIIDEVLVPNVVSLFSFLPDTEFTVSSTLDEYHEKIKEHKQKDRSEFDEAAAELDSLIATRLEELFQDEETRKEVADIVNTFHPSGRYKLFCLLEYANEDGVIEKYPSVLRSALKEEFEYAPPVVARGLDFLPASSRGFSLMIRELGLKVPRPNQASS